MSEKELQHLTRTELLEILLEREKENIALRAQVKELQAKLDDKLLTIDKVGSIAQASLVLNGIFEAAEASCQQYIQNVQLRSARQEQVERQRELESKAQAAALLQETKRKCDQLEQQTALRCQKMEAQADLLVEKKWAQISQRLNDLYASHQGLLELVNLGVNLMPKRGEDDAQRRSSETHD